MDAIHVVGAGGVGCAVGHALALAGAPVAFVERSPAKLAWAAEHGVRVGRRPPVNAPFIPFDDWRPSAGSVVLLCTRCYDNAAVLARLPERARLVPIQNGFDAALQSSRVEGVATFVSKCPPDRTHAHLTQRGRLYLGVNGTPDVGLRELAATLAGLLRLAPFSVTLSEDVRPIKYAKLACDAALCPLAAAGGLANAQVLLRPHARELFFDLLRENLAILTRAGVPLAQVGPLRPETMARALARPWLARPLAWLLARTLRGTHRSLSADLAAGRTEIDNYNGHLVALAGDAPCPLNRLVLALVGRMIARHLPAHVDRLHELGRAFRAARPERVAG
jgi:2-dehydropantoate 2-reductase